jgi:hypothetical protein
MNRTLYLGIGCSAGVLPGRESWKLVTTFELFGDADDEYNSTQSFRAKVLDTWRMIVLW